MEIEICDLFNSIPGIEAPGTRIGLPGGSTMIEIADPGRFAAGIGIALNAFRELWPGKLTLVCAETNSHVKELWIHVVQDGRTDLDGKLWVKESLSASFDSLRAEAAQSGGKVRYSGANNHVIVSLPYPNCPQPDREDFLDLDISHLPWDEQYRVLLEQESWEFLRDRVFRFSGLAAALADRCRDGGMSTVLVPSVGLCVHPWLFGHRGLSAMATDIVDTPLAVLSRPELHPNLYSSAAYERWDISECVSYAMIPHWEHFDGMPALEDDRVRALLQRRITFAVADWARLPVQSGTTDLVFAANAVPRGSQLEREAVLEEWIRILRPGGFVYIAQHHPGLDWDIESFFRARYFVEVDFLGGEALPDGIRGGFQTRYSSG
jgi:hypothetical protein